MSILSSWLPWLALGTGLLALLILVGLVWIVLREARTETSSSDRTRRNDDGPALTYQAASLRQSFAMARNLLRQRGFTRRRLHDIPWILALGRSGAGKTSIMAALRQRLNWADSADGPQVTGGGLDWWLFEQGVVLDVGGMVLAPPGGEAEGQRNFQRLLRLLRSHRSRRPLDGVLLVVPASELMDTDHHDRAVVRAAAWSRNLRQMQKSLGLDLPVYVLVTQCDRIPGFQGFWKHLPPHRRDEMFGWSSPHAPEARFSTGWVAEAFVSLRADLERAMVEMAADPRRTGDGTGLLAFPGGFAALEQPLAEFLERIFQPDAWPGHFCLRGLWFTGSLEEDDRPHPILLRHFFEEKLFAERGLAVPVARVLASRKLAVRAAQGAFAASALVLGGGAVLDHMRIAEEVQSLTPALHQMAEARPDPGLLEVKAPSLTSVFLPTSLLSSIDENLHAMIEGHIGGAYARLARRFSEMLAGRFPFAPPDAGEDVAPDTLRAFFHDHSVILDALAEADLLPEQKQFVRNLASARDFFAGLLGEDDGSAWVLGIDFPAPQEAGPVTEWSLHIGPRRLSSQGDERQGQWRPGEAVAVTLHWAEDAQERPLTVPGGPLVEEDTVRFAAEGSWALLRLAARHGFSTSPERRDEVEQRLLRFDIPVTGSGDPAVLFLRLSVGPAGAAQFQPFPDFPHAAPVPGKMKG
ncbi:type VI secretion system protein [Telmatospirillum sp. J64-1]|uniref:type VI secretion system protein n=1 Tax=Telmatospirillum sp. J64-1 TaxID=2502183 RepID=UPI00115DFF39|nr:type VI secretion system protein [Telmatospirillum sp. J64-1]